MLAGFMPEKKDNQFGTINATVAVKDMLKHIGKEYNTSGNKQHCFINSMLSNMPKSIILSDSTYKEMTKTCHKD